MKRRIFLSYLAGIVGVTAVPSFRSAWARNEQMSTTEWRGVGSSTLSYSTDGGRSWQTSLQLGPEARVLALRARATETIVQVGIQSHRFALYSTDHHLWRPHTL